MTRISAKNMVYAILLSVAMSIAGIATVKLTASTHTSAKTKVVTDAQRLEELERAAPDSEAVRNLVEHERGNMEVTHEGN